MKAAEEYVHSNYSNEPRDILDNDKDLTKSIVFKNETV